MTDSLQSVDVINVLRGYEDLWILYHKDTSSDSNKTYFKTLEDLVNNTTYSKVTSGSGPFPRTYGEGYVNFLFNFTMLPFARSAGAPHLHDLFNKFEVGGVTGDFTLPFESVIDDNQTGLSYTFANLYYTLINTPQVDPALPIVLIGWGSDGNLNWLRITADQQYVNMASGQLGLGLPEEFPDSPTAGEDGFDVTGSTGRANVFYIVKGPTPDANTPTELPTAPALDQVVTATGAACSIIPKNFNLF